MTYSCVDFSQGLFIDHRVHLKDQGVQRLQSVNNKIEGLQEVSSFK